MPFRARLETRWSDEDVQGVLNNAVFLTLLEEARHRWCTALGVLDGADGARFPFVLGQTTVRFLAPGRGRAPVEVELATTRLGARSFAQAYRVRDAERGTTWAEATADLVMWDAERGGSAPMDDAFRAAVRKFEDQGA